jgi:hypothetical protein
MKINEEFHFLNSLLHKMLVPYINFNFYNCYSGGVESNWVHSALLPPICLLCQPRVIMIKEKSVEWLAGEAEVLAENLPQGRFIHHKPYMLPRC